MKMDMEFGVIKQNLAGALALLVLGAGVAFSQENTAPQQKVSSSITPTMPVPKLPYNMPSTRVNKQRYQAEMDRSVANARQQRDTMARAASATGQAKSEKKRSEYLKWSEPGNTLRVTVSEGEGRGTAGETSKPVSALLGARPQGIVPATGAARVSQGSGPAVATAVPVSNNAGPSAIPPPAVVTPAPAPPQGGQPAVGSAVPAPVAGAIPRPDSFITGAGGTPQRFQPPPPPALPEGVNVAPATVPATPPPAPPVAKKRGLFGKMFGGKRQRNRTPEVDTSHFISTGPEVTAPVAPRPTAVQADPGKNDFVIVKAPQGTQFVIAGDTTNGQSGILVPAGTVLKKLGLNGQWTTVKSPNGTTGSVQNIDVRDATFSEAIQFISSGQ